MDHLDELTNQLQEQIRDHMAGMTTEEEPMRKVELMMVKAHVAGQAYQKFMDEQAANA